MAQDLMSCKHKITEECPHASHEYMACILDEMNKKPHSGGMTQHSKYELASRLCKTCESFTQKD